VQEEYGPEIIYIKENYDRWQMQSASYTSKSSSRETKVNDQNKAGVETEILIDWLVSLKTRLLVYDLT